MRGQAAPGAAAPSSPPAASTRRPTASRDCCVRISLSPSSIPSCRSLRSGSFKRRCRLCHLRSLQVDGNGRACRDHPCLHPGVRGPLSNCVAPRCHGATPEKKGPWPANAIERVLYWTGLYRIDLLLSSPKSRWNWKKQSG